jgi:dipeptidyl aminopeptidase/acylaminoacyl peptidase
MNTNTRMNRLLIAACALLAVFSILAIPGIVAVRAQGEAPLLDRELFFGDPEISGSQLSPDGKFITFIKPFKGTRNVWIKRTQEPFASAKPITNETKRPVPSYFWSRDGKYVLYIQDKGGDENYNIYAVNPSESPAAGEDVPKTRNLTDLKAVRVFIYELPKNEPDSIYIGLNDRDASWHDLYRLTISTGERTLLRKNTDRLTGWVFDAKGKLRLATRSADNGDTEVLRVDQDGFKKVYSCSVFESCDPVHFHKDGDRVYMETNKGDDVDLARLTLFNPATGKEELVESDPMNKVDLTGAVFSDLTDELVATSYVEDRTRVYFKDKAYEADYNWVRKQLGDKEIAFQSLTRDERMAIVSARSDTEPGEVYLFDRNAKKLTLQYRVRENVPRDALSPMKSIKYKSSDGLEIPAYLTLPKGLQAKNLPLIVFPHGGPWARDNWGYNTFAQFLSNRGYAVLEPNFRSSTGYGKKFLNAGNLQWGDKMQDDLTWGVKYLVAEGIADPKRVGIMGGSYGGYATLAGVAFTPDVYAAGVSIVGPSNLITLLESIPPYWEAGRVIFHRRMGDPSTSEGKAQLSKQSPLNSANKIKAPLLVIQGANDPRVNKAESDQIVIALRDRGFPVEYIVAPDEGHGFARPINNLAMITSAEKFLAKFLGGRYQQDAKPEVATRLKEITVDVKTVTRTVRVEAASVSVPKPAVDLRPGSVAYQAKIEMGGQVVPLSIKREIREEGGTWVVKETAQTPMGELSDQSVLEKGSLVLTQRSVKQGPIVIDLAFKDNKASGQMNMNGEAKQVSADVGGALFADGAGAYDVMAALPLKEGYTATFRNFDVQRQKVKLMQLKVAGVEKVTVPAGTFDAYKVDIASADGASDRATVWVAKDSRQVVKMTATLPEMGGAVLTTELEKQN